MAAVDTKDPREACLFVAQRLRVTVGQPLNPYLADWLVSRLERIWRGESPDSVFGTKRRRGQRHLPEDVKHQRMHAIAKIMVVDGLSLNEAARDYAHSLNEDSDGSAMQKFARANRESIDLYRRVVAASLKGKR
ncbi:hypothetical protein [uncultured Thiohalocapsa sp.]|uniref:hypothetical protein n=1 Tax=uncultured Thiohalocapsa sp. TaxID=768990 RepID=UPI0025E743F9|nr:hypothetical protein [uncultured Thiohalocapsa sp.]